MEVSVFLGAFAAVIMVFIIGFGWARRKIRRIFGGFPGQDSLVDALLDFEEEAQNTPKSLSGCDRLLLPAIFRDFPDFDPDLVKIYVKEYLTAELGSHPGFTIHNIVISQYLPSSAQKTIVYQAALAWLEEDQVRQKRFEVSYCYLLPQDAATVAANCPNCGGTVDFGETHCRYCDSRIANVLKNTWEFKNLTET